MKEFHTETSRDVVSAPLEDNIFEWQFAIRGAADTEYEVNPLPVGGDGLPQAAQPSSGRRGVHATTLSPPPPFTPSHRVVAPGRGMLGERSSIR